MSPAWIVAFAILAALVVVLTFAVLGVVRRCLPILIEAEAALRVAPAPGFPAGLAPGTPVPDFTVVRGGRTVFASSDLRGRSSIVLFTGPHCPACQVLMDEMLSARSLDLPCELVTVVEGAPHDPEFAVSEWFRVIYAEPGEVSTAFATHATPHAFAVDDRGVVVGAVIPNTLEQLVRLAQTSWRGGEQTRKAQRPDERPILTS